MVNRDINFNRSKIKKLKNIRDIKKGKMLRKRSAMTFPTAAKTPLTKKEERRQKRIARIYEEVNKKSKVSHDISTENLVKNKIMKRRNYRKKNKNVSDNNIEMQN